jgi:hypothetical protein
MLGDLITEAPIRLQRRLYEAFDLHMLYNKHMHQVTIWATSPPAHPAPSPPSSTTATTATPPTATPQSSRIFGSPTPPLWTQKSSVVRRVSGSGAPGRLPLPGPSIDTDIPDTWRLSLLLVMKPTPSA